MHIYQDHTLVEACFIRALQMTASARSKRRKGTPLRKRTNKDHFRCLISICSTGITRRGLNELIFVKTSNSTKNQHFSLFFACSSKLVWITCMILFFSHVCLFFVAWQLRSLWTVVGKELCEHFAKHLMLCVREKAAYGFATRGK